MQSVKRALVTDGLWRKSLSAIRSLGKAGFHVSVMGDTLFTTGFWSRYAKKRIYAPTALEDPKVFGEFLLEHLKKYPGTVVLPMEDASLHWAATHSAEVMTHGKVLLPSLQAIEIAQDKGATIAIAKELGLPCPNTIEPTGRLDFVAKILQLKGDGYVVKPRKGSGSSGVAYGGTYDQDGWEKHWEKYGPLLLQERIPSNGRGLGVSVLMDQNGDCSLAFAHERLQQYPVSGGPSTDRHSIHAPEIMEWSIRLLKRLSWKGIAMVEWKMDPRDQKPKLMEINPRFWGSLELAVRSGMDFPTLYAKAALGEKLGPSPSYPPGVRVRWFMPGEILRFLSQPKKDRESLRQFLRGLPFNAEEWDWRDLPGALATWVCTFALALNPRYWKFVRRG